MSKEMADQANTETETTTSSESDQATPDQAEVSAKSAEADQPPQYQPNFKYKVYDQEHEMPEWSRSYLTSKEAEENFRKLFAQAGGFEPLKEKYTDAQTRRQEAEARNQEVLSRLNQLQYYLDNGDMESFFEDVGIKEDQLIEHVKRRLKMGDLPQDQRQLYEQNRTFLKKNYETQQSASQLAAQNLELQRNQHEFEYTKALDMPEVKSFQKVFEERLGAGALRKHADQYGDLMYHKTGRNLAPLEAINHVVSTYSAMFKAPEADGEISDGQPAKKTKKDVIPNVGRGQTQASPVKKRVKSIDDLRKIVADMQSAQ